jgi:hypothetical protein
LVECGPCPDLASYTLAFALQLRKKHGKTSVRVVYQYEKASSFCRNTAVVISSLINFLALATESILSKTVLSRDDRYTE